MSTASQTTFQTAGEAVAVLFRAHLDQPGIAAFAALLDDLIAKEADPGAVPVAVLGVGTNPTATDTVTIGSDVYEFQAAAANLASDTNIAVLRGGNAAASLVNLLAAVNGTADAEHASIFQTDGVTPAVGVGTELVVADAIGATMRLRPADTQGGTPRASDPSIALSETFTAAGDTWDVGNVNMNTLGGRAPSGRPPAICELAITAAMITEGTVRIGFENPVTRFTMQSRTAAGAENPFGTDSAAIANGDVVLTLNGGAGQLAATDIVVITAYF